MVDRTIEFYRKNGLLKALNHVLLLSKRYIWEGNMILFYYRLEEIPDLKINNNKLIDIERITREEDIPDSALRRLLNHWNEPIMKHYINERFKKGATLWLVKLDKDYVGFGWSIIGTTIEPYFFPLTYKDAHLFNLHIYPEYRGQGINSILLNHILLYLKKEGVQRAFAETHAWNKAAIRFFKKTYCEKLGEARKIIIFNKTIIIWSHKYK